jgi:hypothetical protein
MRATDRTGTRYDKGISKVYVYVTVTGYRELKYKTIVSYDMCYTYHYDDGKIINDIYHRECPDQMLELITLRTLPWAELGKRHEVGTFGSVELEYNSETAMIYKKGQDLKLNNQN